jgi:two-component system response regulator MprA
VEDERPSILVIADDEWLTAALRWALALEGYRVRVVRTGLAGIETARLDRPNLVVLDVSLPGMDWLEVARRLNAGGQVPILMLSAQEQLAKRVPDPESDDGPYLAKPFAFEELLARVRTRLRRREEPLEALPAQQYADLVLPAGTREVWRGERLIPLTNKEFDLLLLFLRNVKRVLSHEFIVDQIWGHDVAGDSNVLQVYIARLRAKLEAEGEPRLLHTVRNAGYVLHD